MSIELMLYLCDVIPSIGVLFGSVATSLSVLWALAFAPIYIERWDEYKKPHLLCAIPIFILALISTVIPSRQTMMLMVGASITKDVAASEIGKKVETILHNELDKYLKKEDK